DNDDSPFPETALQILSEDIRGVGPATASLILSVASQALPQYTGPSGPGIPFFSDELVWWLCLGRYPGSGNGEKHNRVSIKYNTKEYAQLFEAVGELRKRIAAEAEKSGDSESAKPAFSVVDIEKIAYVTGHIELSGFGQESKKPDREATDENQS